MAANAMPGSKPTYETWQDLPEAQVISVPANAIPETAMLMVTVQSQVLALCNFAHVSWEGNASAEHCISLNKRVEKYSYFRDMIIEPSFTEFVRKKWIEDISYMAPRLPRAVEATKKNLAELNGETLQIRWCLPDRKKDAIYCYTITGKAIQERHMPPWIFTIRINPKDLEKIGSRRRPGSSDTAWMSVSPVFDSEGKFVGVYNMQNLSAPLWHIEMYIQNKKK